ncbi:SNF2-related protein [Desulfatitalea alkaliphila]|uniref:SNF2-related protein n=1 Tax=Desulfatitalea alkaliphila TaxID=2929485 RepID=A0AA41R8K4_9BACT|nr:SNF2-related protein [Desulfatitalea alkaliphila]MCJ8503180.1 SNF2-related protein [Desulfatitalea alkaliphila]
MARIDKLGAKIILYPDAEEFIQQSLLRARMTAVAEEIRKDPEAHPLRRSLLKTKMRPYQLDGIAFAAGADRAILADDMGLDKTNQGISVVELLARQAPVSKVLIICPASVRSQWRSEILRFSDRSCDRVLGGAVQRAAQ